LVGLLSELDHHVHPGHYLAPLAAMAQEARGGAEVLLIVPHAVAVDPEFVAAAAVLAEFELRTMVVHRDGRCELFEQRGRNRVRVLTTMLDTPARPARPPARPTIDPRACPLLLAAGQRRRGLLARGRRHGVAQPPAAPLVVRRRRPARWAPAGGHRAAGLQPPSC
jgi:hypothetical protein